MLGFLAPASAHPSIGPGKKSAHPSTCDGRAVTGHIHRAHVLFKDAYALERWESGPKRSEIKAAQDQKACIRIERTRKQLSEFRQRRADAFHEYAAQQRAVAAVTPYNCGSHGNFAVPCQIVSRESGYNPRAENPNSTAGGYYQIIDSSWSAYGGSDNGCYHVAACASVEEQHLIAAKMWAGGAGASHWSQTNY